MTVIAVCAFLAFQFGAMYFLISASIAPLKKDIARLETGQAKLSASIAPLKKDIARLETGQAKLSVDIAEIKQLLKKP